MLRICLAVLLCHFAVPAFAADLTPPDPPTNRLDDESEVIIFPFGDSTCITSFLRLGSESKPCFKSAPVDGRLEIAYGTLPGHEGKGVATTMAKALVEMVDQEGADLTVFAQTLPEGNASTSILKKLGFTLAGTVEHPEDGTVWEWELR